MARANGTIAALALGVGLGFLLVFERKAKADDSVVSVEPARSVRDDAPSAVPLAKPGQTTQPTSTELVLSPDNIRRTRKWAKLIDSLRGKIPAWILIGHIAKESGGNAADTTDNYCCTCDPPATFLKGKCPNGTCKKWCRERGLMQLMPEQSAKLGFNHDLMLPKDKSDKEMDRAAKYSIEAGVKMYLAYADYLRNPKFFGKPFASDDDFWRAAYFLFGSGAGTAMPFLREAAKKGPVTWANVDAAVRDACSKKKCKDSTLRHLRSNELAYKAGKLIEREDLTRIAGIGRFAGGS